MATQVWRSLALLLFTTSLVIARYAELEAWRGAGRPATAAQEAEDERRDAELLAAVRNSLHQWELKKARTRTKRSQGSVCYGQFGCFEDSGPFAYLETLPSPPQEVGTNFLMYSTMNRGDQPLMSVSAANMSAAWSWAERAFDSSKPTRIIVHGFGSNCDNVWVYEMRSALMAVEECNVVCVDWEGGASMPNYLRAAANTRLVGKQLAMMLQGLAEHIDLKFEDVHLIGFSLGAHVAGFAGSELRNISRITGLDPAGPLFDFQDPRVRLDSTDAKFVDVIHSNGETLILGGLGAAQPLGHVDFYPNGGRVQHGCSNLFVGAVSDLVLPWAAASAEGRSLCNHRRAYKFFTDSVSPKCHFPAFPCLDYDTFLEGRCFPCSEERRCGNMGYYADRSLGRGPLYLVTREEEPFCAHQYHVSVWGATEPGEKTTYGKITLTLHGDSGLNESFPMNKRENNQVGRLHFSRVLVPHPALGVPLRVTLHYAAYSGWLTAGARAVRLHKFLITDSFGKTSSFCKHVKLTTDESVRLPLYPGDCPMLQDNESDNATVLDENIKEDKTKEPSIDVLDNELPEDPPRTSFVLVDNYEWDSVTDTGRAFGMTNTKTAPNGIVEIAEPVLRPRPRKTPRQRIDIADESPEISEPLLRPTRPPRQTPPSSRKPKNYDVTTPTYETFSLSATTEKEELGFAVQFLPSRLASFISRAERYARDTLLPLVSAYAPRLPIFGARELPKPTAKYIPTEDGNVTSSVPVPTPTLEMKIESLRNMGPPGEMREIETPEDPDIPVVISTTTTTSTTTTPSTTTTEKLRPAPTEMLQVIPGPVVTTSTALPPVALHSAGEKILIVYPSNAREERKIKSHSVSEEMQFEALYRHIAEPEVRVDLPTFHPPPSSPDPSSTVQSKGDSRFIPVPFLQKTDLKNSPELNPT
ncbi:Pancreatic lipase-related protein 1 [Papilio machaon]|uniref:Pancreatic lipase-related protein 1 n=1 Tax=Papilio machaon TaxID=76193 RepID=A0A194R5Y2_PAPMA|nr:Pancreatic lipase-related protein 1 [Papilio machaon]